MSLHASTSKLKLSKHGVHHWITKITSLTFPLGDQRTKQNTHFERYKRLSSGENVAMSPIEGLALLAGGIVRTFLLFPRGDGGISFSNSCLNRKAFP